MIKTLVRLVTWTVQCQPCSGLSALKSVPLAWATLLESALIVSSLAKSAVLGLRSVLSAPKKTV